MLITALISTPPFGCCTEILQTTMFVSFACNIIACRKEKKKMEKISRALLGKPEVPWTAVQKARGIIRHQGARAAARRKHSPPRLPLFSRSVFWRLRSNMSRGSSSCSGFLFCSILPPTHTHPPNLHRRPVLQRTRKRRTLKEWKNKYCGQQKDQRKKVTFFKRFSHTFFSFCS